MWGILSGNREVAFATVGVALLTDVLDGWLARRSRQVTEFGRALDPVADKIFAVGVLGALVAKGQVPKELLAVVVARDLAIVAWAVRRIRAGKGTPVSNRPGKTAFALLGIYALGMAVEWPFFDAAGPWVVVLYVLAGLTYACQSPVGAVGEERA
jgi:phosphatidylglycerophosphate synthase